MEELKTLKDIEQENEMRLWQLRPSDFTAQLRLEAIKWIKSMQDKEWDYDDEWACCEMGNRSEAIEWIKHFFNIKEEELR